MAFYIWLKFLSVYIQCIVLHRVPQIAILRYAVNIDKFSMDMYFDEVYGFIFALVPEVKNIDMARYLTEWPKMCLMYLTYLMCLRI